MDETPHDAAPREPLRVVVVRLPKSLHERLRIAGRLPVANGAPSMNRFCVRALTEAVDAALPPAEDAC